MSAVSSNNGVDCPAPHKTLFPKTGFREFNLPQVIGVLTQKIWLKTESLEHISTALLSFQRQHLKFALVGSDDCVGSSPEGRNYRVHFEEVIHSSCL